MTRTRLPMLPAPTGFGVVRRLAQVVTNRVGLVSSFLLLAWGVGATGYLNAARAVGQTAPPRDTAETETVVVIQDYAEGLSGVRAANPGVHLSVGRDPSMPDEPVLIVEYPAPTGDPAGRDVQCEADNEDWSAGRAISFRIKPAKSLRLSVSFFDRNQVAYTTWTDLKGGVWQLVRIPFDEIRPNPYFQRPDAKVGAPIDVSAVKGIAFAPQDRASGRLTLGRLVVSK